MSCRRDFFVGDCDVTDFCPLSGVSAPASENRLKEGGTPTSPPGSAYAPTTKAEMSSGIVRVTGFAFNSAISSASRIAFC